MKTNIKKLLLSIMFILAIMFLAMSLGAYKVNAEEDNRIVVSTIEGTSSDINTIPVYGGEIKAPTFTMTSGQPAYFYTWNEGWQRKEGDTWFTYDYSSNFISGTWRYMVAIYIDNDEDYTDATAGDTHKLAEQITVKVNGENWNVEPSKIETNYSYTYAYSKEYTIPEPENLVFHNYDWLEIYSCNVGIELDSFSVASCAEGGIKPYTFSKKSGPNWINVSNDGTISGTPTVIGDNDNLIVQVTDSSNPKKLQRLQ